MTVAQQTPVPATSRATGAGQASLICSMARLLELKREPEVIFWVFGFPILLASVSASPSATSPPMSPRWLSSPVPALRKRCPRCSARPRGSSIRADMIDEQQALQGFRLGKYDLVVAPDGKDGFQYRYDPARPEVCLPVLW